MNYKKRVTINDVANEAGVSIKTVSRVINDRPDVAPETRKNVKEIIARLGYHPSKFARGLSQGRSGSVGVITYGVKYFGPASVLSGVEDQAHEQEYTVFWEMLRDSEKPNVEKLLQDLLALHIDGIFWAVPEIPYDREWIIQALSQLSIPVVINTTQPPEILSASIVSNKNEEGGQVATLHLIEQGYRHIGLITGPLDWRESRMRRRGWENTLKENGREIQEDRVIEGDWTAESGARGLSQLIERCPDTDAVFCSNDQMALGALWAAGKMGLRVPGDIAVIGYDDIPEGAYFNPPLTTIHQETFEMGICAIKELDRLIEASWSGEEVEPRTIEFEPGLIVRESTVIRE